MTTDIVPTQLEAALDSGLQSLGMDLDGSGRDRLMRYLGELQHWGRRVNLTAIREPEEMVARHLLDSLSASPFCSAGTLLDVGSGAGLPGMVLAMARPDLRVTSVESRGRKAAFQRHVVRRLGITNVDVIQQRVEDVDSPPIYDQIIARAFASLERLAAVSGHLLSPAGRLLAMKGQYPGDELDEVASDWEVVTIERLSVPQLEHQRHMVVLRRSAGVGNKGKGP